MHGIIISNESIAQLPQSNNDDIVTYKAKIIYINAIDKQGNLVSKEAFGKDVTIKVDTILKRYDLWYTDESGKVMWTTFYNRFTYEEGHYRMVDHNDSLMDVQDSMAKDGNFFFSPENQNEIYWAVFTISDLVKE